MPKKRYVNAFFVCLSANKRAKPKIITYRYGPNHRTMNYYKPTKSSLLRINDLLLRLALDGRMQILPATGNQCGYSAVRTVRGE